MKPYYPLSTETETQILRLIGTADNNGLGNVSFEYYDQMKTITFKMSEIKTGWILYVSQSPIYKNDRYLIVDGKITYEKSESEI